MRNRPLLQTLLPAVLLALVGASSAPAAELLDADAARRAVQELGAQALKEGAVGLSVAVAYGNDIVVSEGFGKIELEHDVAANPQSMYRIGSITKQFTAALIMQQVEAGKIGLDDDINEYIEYPTGEHTVTVRQLLTHTSGIKSYTGLGEEWRKTVPLEMTHEELLDFVRDRPFDFAPDEKWLYNNTGYYMLGMILEKVTGETFADLLLQKVAEPLELSRTRYGSNGDIIPNRAQGYGVGEDGEPRNDALIGMTQPGAAGAMLSTAEDLLQWQRALIGGAVVSADSYRQMTTPHKLANGEATAYGFGLQLDEAFGMRTVRHGGGINGFNSMLVHYPETGVGIAVISNSEGYRASKLTREIAKAVQQIEVEVADLEVSPDEQKRLSGVYVLDDIGLEITVRGRGQHLFFEPAGQREERILRQEDGRYLSESDDAIVLRFDAGSPAPGFNLKQGVDLKAKRKK